MSDTLNPIDYFRRYLNDVDLNQGTSSTPVEAPSGVETDDTEYFRRYLNDPH